MTTVEDAGKLLRELATLQHLLLDALHAAFPSVAQSLPTQWPPRVELRVAGMSWRGALHGLGYRFESDDGRVLEAHDRILEAPYPIDAYRTAVCARSRGIQAIASSGSATVEPEPEEVQRLLTLLERGGVLVRDARVEDFRPPRYLLVAPVAP